MLSLENLSQIRRRSNLTQSGIQSMELHAQAHFVANQESVQVSER